MNWFDGNRVVITGAAGGVGSALVRYFGELNARIVACDLPGAVLFHSAIEERHLFDLRDSDAVTKASVAILRGGTPSVVVLNAGWTRQETLATTTSDGILDEINANFTAAARLTHLLLPAMRAATGNRAFVFVSSVNALGHFGNPTYSAAKAATLAWMRAIAVEEGRHGIRANAVIPASIRTGAWEHRLQADPEIFEKLRARYPLGRIVTPDEVAHAVVFLASPSASGITGTSLMVDAGISAGNLPFLDAIT